MLKISFSAKEKDLLRALPQKVSIRGLSRPAPMSRTVWLDSRPDDFIGGVIYSPYPKLPDHYNRAMLGYVKKSRLSICFLQRAESIETSNR
jgi:hypothetical protein